MAAEKVKIKFKAELKGMKKLDEILSLLSILCALAFLCLSVYHSLWKVDYLRATHEITLTILLYLFYKLPK
jgi:hypothetical protein